MTPGRELDRLVAEKVMGLTIVQMSIHPFLKGMDGGPWCVPTLTEEQLATLEPGEKLVPKPVPPYSTDIAAAWEVVEKMISEGWVSRHSRAKSGIDWQFERWNQKAGIMERGMHLDEEGRAPLAICLAALKAPNLGILPKLPDAD